MHVAVEQKDRIVFEFQKRLSRTRNVCTFTQTDIVSFVDQATETVVDIELGFSPQPGRWKPRTSDKDRAEIARRFNEDYQALNRVRSQAHPKFEKEFKKRGFKKVDKLTKSPHPQKPQNQVVQLKGNEGKITADQIEVLYQTIFDVVLPRRESISTETEV